MDIFRKRGRAFLVLGSISNFIFSSSLISFLTCFLSYQQECFIFLFIMHAFGSMTLFMNVIKTLNLVYENCRSRIAFELDEGNSTKFNIRPIETFSNFYFSLFRNTKANKGIAMNSNLKFNFSKSEYNLAGGDIASQFNGKVSEKALLLSLIPLCMLSVALFIIPIVIFTKDALILNGCPDQIYVYAAFLITTAILFIILPLIFWSVYLIHDGFGLRNEIIFSAGFSFIFYFLFVIGFFYPISPPMLGNGFYALLMNYNYQLFSVIIPVFRAYSHSKISSRVENSRFDYKRIINNPELFHDLKEVMTKELCIENALFLDEIERGRLKYLPTNITSSCISVVPERKLWSIYRKFIEEGAPFQLNISCDSGDRIKEMLKSEIPCGYEIYNDILDEVHAMIFENSFQRYLLIAKKTARH